MDWSVLLCCVPCVVMYVVAVLVFCVGCGEGGGIVDSGACCGGSVLLMSWRVGRVTRLEEQEMVDLVVKVVKVVKVVQEVGGDCGEGGDGG